MGGRRLPAARLGAGTDREAGAALTGYHRYLRVGHLRIRYEDAGQGSPVLLLHGIGHSLRNWMRTVPALVAAGHRAISIDTPGFGYSEAPAEMLDEDGLTDLLDTFLDTFYLDRVDLVGHSLGGALATVYGLRRPGRVRRLALVAPAVGPDVNPALRLLALPVARPLLRPIALRQVFSLLAASWEKDLLEEEVAEAERWLSDPQARHHFWNVLRTTLRLRGVRPDWLLLDRLTELEMPVMVAWGGRDQILPISNLEKVRPRLPTARFEVFETAGHMLPYEVAAEFNAALTRFLGDD